MIKVLTKFKIEIPKKSKEETHASVSHNGRFRNGEYCGRLPDISIGTTNRDFILLRSRLQENHDVRVCKQ